MSSDEDEGLSWSFGIGDTVMISDPNNADKDHELLGTVVALVYDGIFKYKVSWLVGSEVYEAELPEFRLKAPKKSPNTNVILEDDYEKLPPAKQFPLTLRRLPE